MMKGQKMKIMTPIAWGGENDNEDLLDVMANIKKAVPSVTFSPHIAYPNHSGGWPIFIIEFSENDAEALAAFMDFDMEDLKDLEA
jgi:hypothetical protein